MIFLGKGTLIYGIIIIILLYYEITRKAYCMPNIDNLLGDKA
jgi:hypothetical protein